MTMKILVAKVSPHPKVYISSENIFEEQTQLDCEYMVAQAIPYILGSNNVKFEISFGIIKMEKIRPSTEILPELEFFIPYKSLQISLTSEEIESWGIDDEECYRIISNKLGVECISFKQTYIR